MRGNEGDLEPAATATDGPAASYFSLQASWGLTRHLGGTAATAELADRCGVGPGSPVLDVGCGVGATPRYLAAERGSEVVAVDLSPGMADWTRRRADVAGVGDAVEVVVADARALPFDDGRFDAVVSESVAAFVEEREDALAEYARVASPGGAVGINEATWDGTPPDDAAVAFAEATGAKPATAEQWTALLAGAGLGDVTAHRQELSALEELASELRVYGPVELLRAWCRFLAVLVRRPAARGWARDLLSSLRRLLPLMRYVDYGLYVGRKPE